MALANWGDIWGDIWGPIWAEDGVLVEVPDVVGDSEAAGTATLEGDGFVVAVAFDYHASVPAGDIISQSPSAGSMVASGTVVTITVSYGPVPVTQDTQEGSGGWGFLNLYETELNRRRRREKRRKELEEETQRISDETDRQIAEFFREKERNDDKRAELDELASMVRSNDDLDAAKEYSEEVAKAFTQALITGRMEALAELDRELKQALEEEEFLLMVLVAMH